MSYPRAKSSKKRHSRKRLLQIAGAVVALVLVGVGTYLFVERRQEIDATQAAYRSAAMATTPSAPVRSSTVRPIDSTVAAPVPAPPVTTTTVTTTTVAPAPPPPEASPEPVATSSEDQTYLDLLSVSGYPVDTANSRVYIDQAIAACQALRDGRDGQDVVNTISAAAQDAGLTADQGEGVVYIGVASYCDEVSDQLP
jgi:cytoskeletal protein RodZ